MTPTFSLLRDPRRAAILAVAVIACAALLAFGGKALLAQIGGDRGIAAVAASGDIQVGGIEVDVTGKTAEEAREEKRSPGGEAGKSGEAGESGNQRGGDDAPDEGQTGEPPS